MFLYNLIMVNVDCQIQRGLGIWCLTQYFSYIVAVRFISRGNWSTQRQQVTDKRYCMRLHWVSNTKKGDYRVPWLRSEGKVLKIPKRYWKAINRRTDNAMSTRKRTNNDLQRTTKKTKVWATRTHNNRARTLVFRNGKQFLLYY